MTYFTEMFLMLGFLCAISCGSVIVQFLTLLTLWRLDTRAERELDNKENPYA